MNLDKSLAGNGSVKKKSSFNAFQASYRLLGSYVSNESNILFACELCMPWFKYVRVFRLYEPAICNVLNNFNLSTPGHVFGSIDPHSSRISFN